MGARFEKAKTVLGLGTIAAEAAFAITLHRSNVSTLHEKKKVDAVVHQLDMAAALSIGGPVIVKDLVTGKNIGITKIGPNKGGANFTLSVANKEIKDLGADNEPTERVIFEASAPDSKPIDLYDNIHAASSPFEDKSREMEEKIWHRRDYELILVAGMAYLWVNMRNRIEQNRSKKRQNNKRPNKLEAMSLASIKPASLSS